MNKKSRQAMRVIIATSLVLLSTLFALAQKKEKNTEKTSVTRTGILLLAHGGNRTWNEEVNRIAAQTNPVFPTEVAFGMASKGNIQSAVDRLIASGVREIVAVPMFISSHSSIITSTEYLLGLRAAAPPELAIYARMDHSHGSQHASHSATASVDPMTPVKSPVPIRMTAAMGRHPIIADILLARARSISQAPAREVVVLVAHGPVSDEDNAKWLADMRALADHMDKASKFRRIEYLTVKDDAPEPVRSKATAELRSVVEKAVSEGNRVLIVPLLISYGGIEGGIRKRLDGLSYVMSPQALLPDDRIVRWILTSAREVAGNR